MTGERGELAATAYREGRCAWPRDSSSSAGIRNRSLTNEAKLPVCRMTFAHPLVPKGHTTRVVHRPSFSVPLAFFSGRVIGRQVRRGLPEALMRLKALAETHGAHDNWLAWSGPRAGVRTPEDGSSLDDEAVARLRASNRQMSDVPTRCTSVAILHDCPAIPVLWNTRERRRWT